MPLLVMRTLIFVVVLPGAVLVLWVPITLSRPLTWCLLGEGSSS
jgi:hypothetical protein